MTCSLCEDGVCLEHGKAWGGDVPVFTPQRKQYERHTIAGLRTNLAHTTIALGGWRSIIGDMIEELEDLRETLGVPEP